MKEFDNKAVTARLVKLREDKGMTRAELATMLHERLGHKIMFADEEDNNTSRQVMYAIENGKRITFDLLLAYADIFGVSLEYLFCQTDDWQPENKAIKETIGLDDKAIAVLKTAVTDSKKDIFSMEKTKEFIHFPEFINILLGRHFENGGKNVVRSILRYILLNIDTAAVFNAKDLTKENYHARLTGDEILASKMLNIQTALHELRKYCVKEVGQ